MSTGETTILVATGTRPHVPNIPGLESVAFLTSDLLGAGVPEELKEQPAWLLVLRDGYVALELGYRARCRPAADRLPGRYPPRARWKPSRAPSNRPLGLADRAHRTWKGRHALKAQRPGRVARIRA